MHLNSWRFYAQYDQWTSRWAPGGSVVMLLPCEKTLFRKVAKHIRKETRWNFLKRNAKLRHECVYVDFPQKQKEKKPATTEKHEAENLEESQEEDESAFVQVKMRTLGGFQWRWDRSQPEKLHFLRKTRRSAGKKQKKKKKQWISRPSYSS